MAFLLLLRRREKCIGMSCVSNEAILYILRFIPFLSRSEVRCEIGIFALWVFPLRSSCIIFTDNTNDCIGRGKNWYKNEHNKKKIPIPCRQFFHFTFEDIYFLVLTWQQRSIRLFLSVLDDRFYPIAIDKCWKKCWIKRPKSMKWRFSNIILRGLITTRKQHNDKLSYMYNK